MDLAESIDITSKQLGASKGRGRNQAMPEEDIGRVQHQNRSANCDKTADAKGKRMERSAALSIGQKTRRKKASCGKYRAEGKC